MTLLPKNLLVVLSALLLIANDSLGATLSGTAFVNQVNDTAVKAKADAMNVARRQILTEVLSEYADKEALEELLQNASDEDLTNLISSSNVSNEQMSTTMYSAQITMNIDNESVKEWLNTNNIQNWVPLTESDEKFTSVIVVQNGVQDWAEINRIVREDKIEIETKSLTGNQVVAKMPLSYRTKFTADIHEAGWNFSDTEGVLHIWK